MYKRQGMQMLVRSMSPDVVAVDELGCEEDFKAVDSVIHCGCMLIATAHGSCLEEMCIRDRYIILVNYSAKSGVVPSLLLYGKYVI